MRVRERGGGSFKRREAALKITNLIPDDDSIILSGCKMGYFAKETS